MNVFVPFTMLMSLALYANACLPSGTTCTANNCGDCCNIKVYEMPDGSIVSLTVFRILTHQ